MATNFNISKASYLLGMLQSEKLDHFGGMTTNFSKYKTSYCRRYLTSDGSCLVGGSDGGWQRITQWKHLSELRAVTLRNSAEK
jgi:hypothetical protein